MILKKNVVSCVCFPSKYVDHSNAFSSLFLHGKSVNISRHHHHYLRVLSKINSHVSPKAWAAAWSQAELDASSRPSFPNRGPSSPDQSLLATTPAAARTTANQQLSSMAPRGASCPFPWPVRFYFLSHLKNLTCQVLLFPK